MKRKKKTVDIHGVPVTVVSDAEAEKVDYMVCAREGTPTPFTDNFKGFCCVCDTPIIYRWHAPRRPKKICLQCVTEHKDAFAGSAILKKPAKP